MRRYTYNPTTVYIDTTGNEEPMYIDTSAVPREPIPGWMHIDPTSTQIDIDSVVAQLNDNTGRFPGYNVTKEDLTKPRGYENDNWKLKDGRDSDSKGTPKQVSEYLYEIEYDTLDYDTAIDHFLNEESIISPTGCSSVRSGMFYGRNLDWYYDHAVDFIVRTSAEGRHSVLGVSGTMTEIDKAAMQKGLTTKQKKLIPFYLLDGVNDAGVFCNTNVVPMDKGTTTLSVPDEEEEIKLCGIMIPRFILDNFDDAEVAVEYLKKHVSIYMPKALQKIHYEAHYMIGDKNHTYVVEVIDNKVVYKEMDIMTNFYLTDVTLNEEDNKVNTPLDVKNGKLTPFEQNNITENGAGLERFNIARDEIAAANTKEGMRDLMNKLLYSNAYDKSKGDDFWYTEFVGTYGLTANSSADDYHHVLRPSDGQYVDLVDIVVDIYANRTRDVKNTWHTTHSCVYDIQRKKLYIVCQEDTSNEMTYYLKSSFTGEDIDKIYDELLS